MEFKYSQSERERSQVAGEYLTFGRIRQIADAIGPMYLLRISSNLKDKSPFIEGGKSRTYLGYLILVFDCFVESELVQIHISQHWCIKGHHFHL